MAEPNKDPTETIKAPADSAAQLTELVELPAGFWRTLTATLGGMSHMALPPAASINDLADFMATIRGAKVTKAHEH